MSTCQNCGHESHCGYKKYREEIDSITESAYQIKVCDHCRCDKCVIKDTTDG